MVVRDFAGVLLQHEAAKGVTEIRPHEPLRCAERKKNNCLFFRTLEKSNPPPRGASKPLAIDIQRFPHLGGSWHGNCLTRVRMRIKL